MNDPTLLPSSSDKIRMIVGIGRFLALIATGTILAWGQGDPQAQPDFRKQRMSVEPEAFTRLATATPAELVEVLCQPNISIRVPDRTVLQSHLESLWDRAKWRLRPVPAEARPRLARMLENDSLDIRLNGLDVLQTEEWGHLPPLRQTLIRLTTDPDRRVRIASIGLLARVKDQAAENAFITALSRLESNGPKDSSNDEEARAVIDALCFKPYDAAKVASMVAPLIDEKRSSLTVVWTAMQYSGDLSQLPDIGDELIARYWRILSTTADDSLPYIATGSMSDDDERTLIYLRKFAEITNTKARGYAAGKLMTHSLFEPRREGELMRQLLSDSSPWVRRLTIGNLCERGNNLCARGKGAEPEWLVETAMNLAQKDPDKEVAEDAVTGVFRALGNASKDDRKRIWLDPKLGLAKFMIERLDSDDLRRLIVVQTSEVSGGQWGALEEPEGLRICRAWLEQQAKESATAQ